MSELSISHIYIIAGVMLVSYGGLVYYIMLKHDQLKRIRQTMAKLKQSFNDLDEQAKLIVKTDLELNRTQEELDKRLDGLEALQKISKTISTTLDETEIFERLTQALQSELHFEKSLIATFNTDKTLVPNVVQNYSAEATNEIILSLVNNQSIASSLHDGRTFSSINASPQRKNAIQALFDVEHFVISPIFIQNEIDGIIFVGNKSNTMPVTEGDEEIISIIANQIGQALENARLFEQVYSSSRVLESKVHERTHQLEEANMELKEISKKKSDFISAVSHELRTPLTSIKGYASILIAGKLGDIPEQVKARLSKINTHSDNLVNLINNLLDISRIESGRIEMNIKPCEILKIIENVYDLLTPQIGQKNIECVIDVDKNIPEIEMDSNQVERIFINLVGNAIKFTPEQGTITIKAALQNNQTIECTVSDTGIGISQEDIAKLFDEFYRVDNKINESVKGTGLGLPLAKKIVEAHHGRMWITSVVGQGTTFHFTLPFTQPRQHKGE